MKNHVVSLEIAKQLKEAGWDKKTTFCWLEIDDEWILDLYANDKYNDVYTSIIPAPLATEILEELPDKITLNTRTHWLWIGKMKGYEMSYTTHDDGDMPIAVDDESLPDALAKMWLYLKQNNLLPSGE